MDKPIDKTRDAGPLGWVLRKRHLSYWLRQLRKESDLIAPTAGNGGDIIYTSIPNIHEIAVGQGAALSSPKEILFPQLDPLFWYDTQPGAEILEIRDIRPRVIFGLRSCEVSGILFGDEIMGGTFRDPVYWDRRENTLLISIGCNSPEPTCFCQDLQAGPFLEKGFDIQLTDLSDRFFVEAGTDKGKQLVQRHRSIFERAERQDREDRYEATLLALGGFERRIHLKNIQRMMVEESIPDSFWEEKARRCFSCGGCVYACPVCFCFHVEDRPDSRNSGVRMRHWDACLFRGFTRLAGGVDLHPGRTERYKRYFYHKLLHYPERLGRFGCVGCGRCTLACPARIDLPSMAYALEIGHKE